MSETNQVKEAYDGLVPSYDEVRFRRISRKQVDQLIRDYIHHQIEPGSRVLELGCGTGRITAVLLDIAESVTAVDISEAMLEVTRSKLGESNSLDLIRSDVFALDEHVPAQTFDAVVTLRMLPHIRDTGAALRIVASFAAPRGHVLFDLWNNQSLLGFVRRVFRRKNVIPTFFYPYDEMLEFIEQAGLGIESEMPLWIYPRLGRLSLDGMSHPILKRYARAVVFKTRRIA